MKQCVNGIRGTSWLLRDKEMKASEGGYRETESGLDASFLWSHDKSGKDKGRGGKLREEKVERTCKATRGGREERKRS